MAKTFIYHPEMSHSFFETTPHLAPEEIAILINNRAKIEFYPQLNSIRHIPNFKLACVKRGTERYFFLVHTISQNIILFPPFEVAANEHTYTDHSKHLEKILSPARIAQLENFIPLPPPPVDNEESLTDILPNRDAEIETTLAKLESPLNLPSDKTILQNLKTLCADIEILTTLKLKKNQPYEDRLKQISHQYLSYFFNFIEAYRDICFLSNNSWGEFSLICHDRHGIVHQLSLGKTNHIFFKMLGKQRHTELTEKQGLFFTLSVSLFFDYSLERISNQKIDLSHLAINYLIEEGLRAVHCGLIEFDELKQLINILQNRSWLQCISKHNLTKVLSMIELLWRAGNSELAKKDIDLLFALLSYCDDRQIKRLFDRQNPMLSKELILRFLAKEQEFTWVKIQVIIEWLHTHLNELTPSESKKILSQLLALTKTLAPVEQEVIYENLKKFDFLKTTCFSFIFNDAHTSVIPENEKQMKKSMPAKRQQVEKKIGSIDATWSKLQKINKSIEKQSDPIFKLIQEFFFLVAKHPNPKEKQDYLTLFAKSFIAKKAFKTTLRAVKNSEGLACVKLLKVIELLAVFGQASLLKSIAKFFDVGDLKKHHGEALLHASYYCHLSTLRILLYHFQCDPNLQEPEQGLTPLYVSIMHKSKGKYIEATHLANVLIDAGAEIDKKKHDGVTTLMYAVHIQNIDAIKLLLRRGANPHAGFTLGDNFTYTLRDIAAGMPGFLSKIKAILDEYKVDYSGGPIIMTDEDRLQAKGSSLFLSQPHPSSSSSVYQPGVTMGLREEYQSTGLSQLPSEIKIYISLMDRHGDAIYDKKSEQELSEKMKSILEFLYKNKHLINSNPKCALPFLFYVLFRNQLDALKSLLKDFPGIWLGPRKIFPFQRDQCEILTPVHFAIKWSTPKILEVLLQNSAPLSIADGNGLLPTHFAVLWNDSKKIKLLWKYGADFNAYNTKGLPTLHFAMTVNRLDMVPTLVEIGIDLDFYNQDGYTALQYAVIKSNYSAIPVLVNAGASLSKKTNNALQKDAIELALARKDFFLAKSLFLFRRQKSRDDTNLFTYQIPPHLAIREFFMCYKTEKAKITIRMIADLVIACGKNRDDLKLLNECVAGETIFHVAARRGRVDPLRLLLDGLADTYGQECFHTHINLNLRNEAGKTVLEMLELEVETRQQEFYSTYQKGERLANKGMVVDTEHMSAAEISGLSCIAADIGIAGTANNSLAELIDTVETFSSYYKTDETNNSGLIVQYSFFRASENGDIIEKIKEGAPGKNIAPRILSI